jgi:hypothetical protein
VEGSIREETFEECVKHHKRVALLVVQPEWFAVVTELYRNFVCLCCRRSKATARRALKTNSFSDIDKGGRFRLIRLNPTQRDRASLVALAVIRINKGRHVPGAV